jgi:hypothetical protein
MLINDLYNNKKSAVAEVSDKTLISYLQKVSDDSLKHDQDPSKRSAEKRNRSVSGFAQAFNKLDSRKPDGSIKENDSDVPVHRIGLTVIDPQHPMVSKRKEEYQKTVRVPGHDREQAITAAINHLRRRGFKVLDHHYIGLLEDQLDELNKKTVASWIKQQPERIKGDTGLSRTDFKKARRLVDKSIPSAIAKYKDPGYGKQEPRLDEGSLGDEMAALAQKKFPNAYISKNGEEVQKPENWGKKYVPPAAAPVDLEKQQRDLTAKYPNIDELVRRAELNRDPNYEYADGQAYYAARDAEQNYQKLKQIQRVIQGLNESLDRSHLP